MSQLTTAFTESLRDPSMAELLNEPLRKRAYWAGGLAVVRSLGVPDPDFQAAALAALSAPDMVFRPPSTIRARCTAVAATAGVDPEEAAAALAEHLERVSASARDLACIADELARIVRMSGKDAVNRGPDARRTCTGPA